MPTVNQELADAAVAAQVTATRYAESHLKKIHRLLQEASIDLEQKIYAAQTAISKDRLTRLLGAVDRFAAQLQADLYAETTEDLLQFGKLQASVALHDLETFAGGLGLSFSTPNFDQIASAAITRPMQGKLLKDWWTEWGAGARAAVAQQIRLGVVENETVEQIVRRIRGTQGRNFQDGIIRGLKFRHYAALVRTAVNHVNSHAHQEVWAANDDIVAKVQWVSTLDQATTPICRGRDGETYPVNSGPRPPAHIGCRSTTVPVLKPWDELGLKDPGPRTRASLDGGAPGDMNYQDWLKRMDGKRPGFVRHILGAKRYALWKKGGLSVKQFVNLRTGQEYNLAYLKKAHPEAWKKAFPVGNVKRPPVPKFKGASRPVVTNPKAEMAAWVAQQKKLKAAQKSGAVPKVFNTTEAGITHDRMLGLLEKVPGAVAGARLVRDFISRFQTGSVFGLQSHLTPAGLRKRAAAGNAYLRSLGKPPIEHPSNYTLADLGEWDANVLGWTGRVWNTVMVKIPQDFTNFSKVKPEGLAEVVDGAIKLADIGKKQWSFSKIAQLATTTGDESPKLLTWLHEMGHQVHYRAGRPQFSGYKQATLTRYGAYTHMEFAAEHFVAWVLNRAALQKARPEIVKWLDDMVAKALKPEN